MPSETPPLRAQPWPLSLNFVGREQIPISDCSGGGSGTSGRCPVELLKGSSPQCENLSSQRFTDWHRPQRSADLDTYPGFQNYRRVSTNN